MQKVTSADAQNRFGRLLDMAQREPVAITRHGRIAGCLVGPIDMDILLDALKKRSPGLRDWDDYARNFEASRVPGAPEITEEEIAQEVKAYRAERRARDQRKRA